MGLTELLKKMNIYEPYQVIDKDDALLHLRLSFKDRLLSIIASRVLPILIVIIVFFALDSNEVSIFGFVTAGAVFLAFTTIIVINANTGVEISFKLSSVEIYSLRFIGKRKRSFLYNEIERVELEIFNSPEVSGAYYRLILKNKKRVMLIKVPSPATVEEERFVLLNESIEAMTHLKINSVSFDSGMLNQKNQKA